MSPIAFLVPSLTLLGAFLLLFFGYRLWGRCHVERRKAGLMMVVGLILLLNLAVWLVPVS